jgi:hypothetical protein
MDPTGHWKWLSDAWGVVQDWSRGGIDAGMGHSAFYQPQRATNPTVYKAAFLTRALLDTIIGAAGAAVILPEEGGSSRAPRSRGDVLNEIPGNGGGRIKRGENLKHLPEIIDAVDACKAENSCQNVAYATANTLNGRPTSPMPSRVVPGTVGRLFFEELGITPVAGNVADAEAAMRASGDGSHAILMGYSNNPGEGPHPHAVSVMYMSGKFVYLDMGNAYTGYQPPAGFDSRYYGLNPLVGDTPEFRNPVDRITGTYTGPSMQAR